MSTIALSPAATGSGQFTIASPATNTNRTLTLPDEAGTILTSASNIEAQSKAALNASGSAPVYGARGWVTFTGSTGAIRASGNIASVVRNSAGRYTITLATAMPDANYSVVGMALLATDAQYANVKLDTMAAGSFVITTTTQSSGNPAVFDPATVCITIFR